MILALSASSSWSIRVLTWSGVGLSWLYSLSSGKRIGLAVVVLYSVFSLMKVRAAIREPRKDSVSSSCETVIVNPSSLPSLSVIQSEWYTPH